MNTKRILGLGFLVALSACKGQCSCGTDNDDGDTGSGGAGVTTSVGNGSTSTNAGTGGDGGAGTGGAPGTGGDTTSTGGAPGTGGDATGTGGTGGAAPAGDPQVRFVNVATDAGDVNFCLVDGDGAFIGPLEAAIASPGVSGFAEVVAGDYGFVAIGADAACDDEAAVEFAPVALAEGGVYTLALIGTAEELESAVYEDDLALPAAGNVRLRLVHAAVDAPNVDVGVYDGQQFIPFFTNAEYPLDSGYTEVPAFSGETLVARLAGTETDALEVEDVNGQDGDIVNAYAIRTGPGLTDVDVFLFSDGPVD